MTDAERLAVSTVLRAIGDFLEACETATLCLERHGQKDAAHALASAVVDVTDRIITQMPVLAVSPTMLAARPRDTDASTN